MVVGPTVQQLPSTRRLQLEVAALLPLCGACLALAFPAVSRHLAPLLTCSLVVQEIQHHPWFAEGLNPAALAYNDSILELSLESQPPQEVIEEVRALRVDWLVGKCA